MAVFTAAAFIGASVLGAVGVTGAIATGVTFATVATGFLVQAAVGFALNALAPKPKAPNISGVGSGSNKNRGYIVNQRGSALDHQIIYGRVRVGGAVVFQEVTGNKNKILHQVIAYAGHEIESFDELYINDAKVIDIGDTNHLYTVAYNSSVANLTDVQVANIGNLEEGVVYSGAEAFEVFLRLANDRVRGGEFQNVKNAVIVDVQKTDDTVLRDITVLYDFDETTGESESVYDVRQYTGATTPTASQLATEFDISDLSGNFYIVNRDLDYFGKVRKVRLPNGKTSNRYDGFVKIRQHLGTNDQGADSSLVRQVRKWTNNHRLRGIAYLYIRLRFDADVFPNGAPQITATIKGKKVYDPRTDAREWSDNPALCLRDYISSGYGLAEDDSNIDDTLVATAANVCEETDTNAGTARYTCNGAFTTDNTPYDSLNDILTSMGGLLWYAQGKWRMKPAYWTAPTITFNEDDLRSSISAKTRHSRRDNFNVVRGTFRGEESDWQITDYPEVTNSSFLEADNGQESVADLELPFTDNSIEARRIARIALERNRQQLTVGASFGLRGFQVQVGDVVNLSIERFGWTEKAFEVTSWTFGIAEEKDLQVQMTLREISESVFDEVDDGVIYERDNTELLSPFEAPEVGLSVSNSVEVVYEHARNVITANVTGDSDLIDRVEVQYKRTGDPDWIPVGIGDKSKYQIVDLLDGNYDVRARSINSFNVIGDWKYRLNFPARGLAPPPSQVQNFSAEVNGAVVNLEWDAVPDLDLSYYRIRYTPETTDVLWNFGIDYVEKVAKPATSVSVPARAGTYMIKAVDQGERESTEFTTVVVDPADLEQFTNTLTQTEDPDFTGVKTDCVVTLDGELQIQNTALFDNLSGNLDDLEGEWDFLGTGEILQEEGIYEFSDYIDIGSVEKARVRVDAYQQRFDTQANLFDSINGNLDAQPVNWDELTGNPDLGDTTVISYVSTTEDDPAGTPTWTNYKRLRVADISARAFRFKVKLESNDPGVTPSVSKLDAVAQYN